MIRATRRQFLAVSAGALAAAAGSSPAGAGGASAWIERRRAGPFRCRSEFDLGAYGGLFRDLADLQRELIRTLAVPPARESIELLLFASESSYRAYLQRRFPQLPYRRALYRKGAGPGTVFAYRHPELGIDLRHEGTHALLHSGLDMVPLWLDEGLAEYFERPAGERPGREDYLRATCWDMRLGIVLSIATLEGRRDLSQMTARDYRFAWAWVHFMLHGPAAAHRVLVEYLADIHAARPPGRLSARMAAAVPDLDRQLAAHLKWWRRHG